MMTENDLPVQENVDLSTLNTLRVPSRCAYYAVADCLDQLTALVRWAQQKKLAYYILGGGSNVLLPEYIDALVIQPQLMGVAFKRDGEQVFVTAHAGENWHQLVMLCIENRAYGLENLALIPGSVGAAPIQNIGAYGVEVKDHFYQLQALNCQTLCVESFTNTQCQFAYRDSLFKRDTQRKYIIVSVTFRLSETFNAHMSYPALQSVISEQDVKTVTPQQVAAAVIAIRQAKLPDPDELANAGSFFKNPIISVDHYMQLKQNFPEIVAFDDQPGLKKIAAGWLIDKVGWKGKALSDVAVHAQQALVLVNPSHKPLGQVLQLAEAIQRDVEHMFAIHLEVEPQLFDTARC